MKKNWILLSVLFVMIVYSLPGCKRKIPERSISLSSARRQVTNYGNLLNRQTDLITQNAARIKSIYYGAELFSKKDLEIILSESGCNGIRVYHALNDSGRSVMFIVGVDNRNSDLLPDSTGNNNRKIASAVYNTDNNILTSDGTLRCPSMCDLGLVVENPPSESFGSSADSSAKPAKDSINKRIRRPLNRSADSLKKP